MTHIKPFKAIHYNGNKIDDFSKVVCPPYDVISKEQQTKLHNLSPYNFIHVMLTKERQKDNAQDNKYTRAKKTFEEWLSSGIITEDENPSLYFYRQEYKILGQRHSRLGFIALMKLQDEKNSTIFPHENTHDDAKEDRLKLWSSVKSNLSPIFVGFSDKDKKVDAIFIEKVENSEPLIDLIDDDGVRHVLWRLEDTGSIKDIQKILTNQHFFIADGHHRFEVAKRYRNERLKNQSKLNGDSPFNYIMTYFTNMDSKDLQIFPVHRILRKLPREMDFLEEFFRIDKIKSKEDLIILLGKAGRNEHAFGMYSRDGIKLLRLKNKLLIDKYINEGSEDYKHLDAIILKSFIFDRLEIPSDSITYTKDLQLVTDMVDNEQADVGFVMNAVKIQQLRNIALNGERMPPKTTYFYPKVLSGLTVYKME